MAPFHRRHLLDRDGAIKNKLLKLKIKSQKAKKQELHFCFFFLFKKLWLQDEIGCERPVYKRVAVVEDFFDIIYREHVEFQGIQSGRAPASGKHAGQKRTYRAVSWRVFTQTYLVYSTKGVVLFIHWWDLPVRTSHCTVNILIHQSMKTMTIIAIVLRRGS